MTFSVLLHGQTDVSFESHFMKDTTRHSRVKLRADYFFGSNAITNGFARDYYLGKFISDDRKDDVSKNLSAQNRFAGEACQEISLTFHPDSGNRKVEAYIAYRSRTHAAAKFSRDFFELYFRGNKMFAGKTADLSDFLYQQYTYRQISFGIGNAFKLAANQTLYIAGNLSINQGIKFLNASTGNSWLYTDAAGEYLDAELHAEIYTDDSAAQHPSKLDGTGYAGDVYVEYENEFNQLSFSVENFGSIQWNKWSSAVTIDSLFHFEGIDVEDIFEIGDSIRINDVELDSVFYLNYVKNRSERRITTRLPAKISGSFTRIMIPGKLSALIGIDVLLNTPSTMRYAAGLKYQFNRSNQIGIIIASGGYTGWNGGLSYVHLFPWHFRFEIGSHYLYPMVDYDKARSQGAYLSLSKSF